MASKESVPRWFLWLWSKGLLGALIFLAIIILPLLALLTQLDSQLDRFNKQIDRLPALRYVPPREDANVQLPERVHSGQSLYVPVYSHIYHDGGKPLALETTLSIRNTDRQHSITVRSVDYYDTQGKLVKNYLMNPIQVKPLATIEYLVERDDPRGGSGANFLVDWVSDVDVDLPLVEAVMVGTVGSSSFAFSRSAHVIHHYHASEGSSEAAASQ